MSDAAPLTDPAPMPLSRTLAAYLSDARYESLRLFRTPAFSIPILAMPILFYIFFGVLLPGKNAVFVANFMYVGWTVYGVMGPGLFGFGILVAVERNQGLLTYKRALPMPTGSYLFAKLAMAYVFAAAVMAILAVLAVNLGHVTFSLKQLFTVGAVMSLGVFPACAVGLFIGAWAPASSAAAFANIVYLGMAFLSGLFFNLPPALKTFQPIWPTFHLAQLAAASAGLPSKGEIWQHIAILAGTTAVLIALAARRLARRG